MESSVISYLHSLSHIIPVIDEYAADDIDYLPDSSI